MLNKENRDQEGQQPNPVYEIFDRANQVIDGVIGRFLAPFKTPWDRFSNAVVGRAHEQNRWIRPAGTSLVDAAQNWADRLDLNNAVLTENGQEMAKEFALFAAGTATQILNDRPNAAARAQDRLNILRTTLANLPDSTHRRTPDEIVVATTTAVTALLKQAVVMQQGKNIEEARFMTNIALQLLDDTDPRNAQLVHLHTMSKQPASTKDDYYEKLAMEVAKIPGQFADDEETSTAFIGLMGSVVATVVNINQQLPDVGVTKAKQAVARNLLDNISTRLAQSPNDEATTINGLRMALEPIRIMAKEGHTDEAVQYILGVLRDHNPLGFALVFNAYLGDTLKRGAVRVKGGNTLIHGLIKYHTIDLAKASIQGVDLTKHNYLNEAAKYLGNLIAPLYKQDARLGLGRIGHYVTPHGLAVNTLKTVESSNYPEGLSPQNEGVLMGQVLATISSLLKDPDVKLTGVQRDALRLATFAQGLIIYEQDGTPTLTFKTGFSQAIGAQLMDWFKEGLHCDPSLYKYMMDMFTHLGAYLHEDVKVAFLKRFPAAFGTFDNRILEQLERVTYQLVYPPREVTIGASDDSLATGYRANMERAEQGVAEAAWNILSNWQRNNGYIDLVEGRKLATLLPLATKVEGASAGHFRRVADHGRLNGEAEALATMLRLLANFGDAGNIDGITIRAKTLILIHKDATTLPQLLTHHVQETHRLLTEGVSRQPRRGEQKVESQANDPLTDLQQVITQIEQFLPNREGTKIDTGYFHFLNILQGMGDEVGKQATRILSQIQNGGPLSQTLAEELSNLFRQAMAERGTEIQATLQASLQKVTANMDQVSFAANARRTAQLMRMAASLDREAKIDNQLELAFAATFGDPHALQELKAQDAWQYPSVDTLIAQLESARRRLLERMGYDPDVKVLATFMPIPDIETIRAQFLAKAKKDKLPLAYAT